MYRELLDEHYKDITTWRQLEHYWQQTARFDPRRFAVFIFDDTECILLPHLSRNAPKDWDNHKQGLPVSHTVLVNDIHE